MKEADFEVAIAKVAIYVLTEVRHKGCGRYSQRGRYIQGCYIQWALYLWIDFVEATQK